MADSEERIGTVSVGVEVDLKQLEEQLAAARQTIEDFVETFVLKLATEIDPHGALRQIQDMGQGGGGAPAADAHRVAPKGRAKSKVVENAEATDAVGQQAASTSTGEANPSVQHQMAFDVDQITGALSQSIKDALHEALASPIRLTLDVDHLAEQMNAAAGNVKFGFASTQSGPGHSASSASAWPSGPSQGSGSFGAPPSRPWNTVPNTAWNALKSAAGSEEHLSQLVGSTWEAYTSNVDPSEYQGVDQRDTKAMLGHLLDRFLQPDKPDSMFGMRLAQTPDEIARHPMGDKGLISSGTGSLWDLLGDDIQNNPLTVAGPVEDLMKIVNQTLLGMDQSGNFHPVSDSSPREHKQFDSWFRATTPTHDGRQHLPPNPPISWPASSASNSDDQHAAPPPTGSSGGAQTSQGSGGQSSAPPPSSQGPRRQPGTEQGPSAPDDLSSDDNEWDDKQWMRDLGIPVRPGESNVDNMQRNPYMSFPLIDESTPGRRANDTGDRATIRGFILGDQDPASYAARRSQAEQELVKATEEYNAQVSPEKVEERRLADEKRAEAEKRRRVAKEKLDQVRRDTPEYHAARGKATAAETRYVAQMAALRQFANANPLLLDENQPYIDDPRYEEPVPNFRNKGVSRPYRKEIIRMRRSAQRSWQEWQKAKKEAEDVAATATGSDVSEIAFVDGVARPLATKKDVDAALLEQEQADRQSSSAVIHQRNLVRDKRNAEKGLAEAQSSYDKVAKPAWTPRDPSDTRETARRRLVYDPAALRGMVPDEVLSNETGQIDLESLFDAANTGGLHGWAEITEGPGKGQFIQVPKFDEFHPEQDNPFTGLKEGPLMPMLPAGGDPGYIPETGQTIQHLTGSEFARRMLSSMGIPSEVISMMMARGEDLPTALQQGKKRYEESPLGFYGPQGSQFAPSDLPIEQRVIVAGKRDSLTAEAVDYVSLKRIQGVIKEKEAELDSTNKQHAPRRYRRLERELQDLGHSEAMFIDRLYPASQSVPESDWATLARRRNNELYQREPLDERGANAELPGVKEGRRARALLDGTPGLREAGEEINSIFHQAQSGQWNIPEGSSVHQSMPLQTRVNTMFADIITRPGGLAKHLNLSEKQQKQIQSVYDAWGKDGGMGPRIHDILNDSDPYQREFKDFFGGVWGALFDKAEVINEETGAHAPGGGVEWITYKNLGEKEAADSLPGLGKVKRVASKPSQIDKTLAESQDRINRLRLPDGYKYEEFDLQSNFMDLAKDRMGKRFDETNREWVGLSNPNMTAAQKGAHTRAINAHAAAAWDLLVNMQKLDANDTPENRDAVAQAEAAYQSTANKLDEIQEKFFGTKMSENDRRLMMAQHEPAARQFVNGGPTAYGLRKPVSASETQYGNTPPQFISAHDYSLVSEGEEGQSKYKQMIKVQSDIRSLNEDRELNAPFRERTITDQSKDEYVEAVKAKHPEWFSGSTGLLYEQELRDRLVDRRPGRLGETFEIPLGPEILTADEDAARREKNQALGGMPPGMASQKPFDPETYRSAYNVRLQRWMESNGYTQGEFEEITGKSTSAYLDEKVAEASREHAARYAPPENVDTSPMGWNIPGPDDRGPTRPHGYKERPPQGYKVVDGQLVPIPDNQSWDIPSEEPSPLEEPGTPGGPRRAHGTQAEAPRAPEQQAEQDAQAEPAPASTGAGSGGGTPFIDHIAPPGGGHGGGHGGGGGGGGGGIGSGPLHVIIDAPIPLPVRVMGVIGGSGGVAFGGGGGGGGGVGSFSGYQETHKDAFQLAQRIAEEGVLFRDEAKDALANIYGKGIANSAVNRAYDEAAQVPALASMPTIAYESAKEANKARASQQAPAQPAGDDSQPAGGPTKSEIAMAAADETYKDIQPFYNRAENKYENAPKLPQFMTNEERRAAGLPEEVTYTDRQGRQQRRWKQNGSFVAAPEWANEDRDAEGNLMFGPEQRKKIRRAAAAFKRNRRQELRAEAIDQSNEDKAKADKEKTDKEAAKKEERRQIARSWFEDAGLTVADMPDELLTEEERIENNRPVQIGDNWYASVDDFVNNPNQPMANAPDFVDNPIAIGQLGKRRYYEKINQRLAEIREAGAPAENERRLREVQQRLRREGRYHNPLTGKDDIMPTPDLFMTHSERKQTGRLEYFENGKWYDASGAEMQQAPEGYNADGTVDWANADVSGRIKDWKIERHDETDEARAERQRVVSEKTGALNREALREQVNATQEREVDYLGNEIVHRMPMPHRLMSNEERKAAGQPYMDENGQWFDADNNPIDRPAEYTGAGYDDNVPFSREHTIALNTQRREWHEAKRAEIRARRQGGVGFDAARAATQRQRDAHWQEYAARNPTRIAPDWFQDIEDPDKEMYTKTLNEALRTAADVKASVTASQRSLPQRALSTSFVQIFENMMAGLDKDPDYASRGWFKRNILRKGQYTEAERDQMREERNQFRVPESTRRFGRANPRYNADYEQYRGQSIDQVMEHAVRTNDSQLYLAAVMPRFREQGAYLRLQEQQRQSGLVDQYANEIAQKEKKKVDLRNDQRTYEQRAQSAQANQEDAERRLREGRERRANGGEFTDEAEQNLVHEIGQHAQIVRESKASFAAAGASIEDLNKDTQELGIRQQHAAKAAKEMAKEAVTFKDVGKNLLSGFVGGMVGNFAMMGQQMVMQTITDVAANHVIPFIDQALGGDMLRYQTEQQLGSAMSSTNYQHLRNTLAQQGFDATSISTIAPYLESGSRGVAAADSLQTRLDEIVSAANIRSGLTKVAEARGISLEELLATEMGVQAVQNTGSFNAFGMTFGGAASFQEKLANYLDPGRHGGMWPTAPHLGVDYSNITDEQAQAGYTTIRRGVEAKDEDPNSYLNQLIQAEASQQDIDSYTQARNQLSSNDQSDGWQERNSAAQKAILDIVNRNLGFSQETAAAMGGQQAWLPTDASDTNTREWLAKAIGDDHLIAVDSKDPNNPFKDPKEFFKQMEWLRNNGFENLAKSMEASGIGFKVQFQDMDDAAQQWLTVVDELNRIADPSQKLTGFLSAQEPTALPNMMQQFYDNFSLQTIQGQAQLGVQEINNPFMKFGVGIAGGPTKKYVDEAAGYDSQIAANHQRHMNAVLEMIDALPDIQIPEGGSIGGTEVASENLVNLKDAAMDALREVEALGDEMLKLNTKSAKIQAAQALREYNHELYLSRRQVSDLAGLTGQANGSELGQLERRNLLAQRHLQMMQLEDQQRNLNYERALAGFSYEGATPEEAAMRWKIAQIKTRRSQSELDIQKGITTTGFKIVDIQNLRQFRDTLWALNNLQKKWSENRELQTIAQQLQRVQRLQTDANERLNRYLGASSTWEQGRLEFIKSAADATVSTITDVTKAATDAYIRAANAFRATQGLPPLPLSDEAGGGNNNNGGSGGNGNGTDYANDPAPGHGSGGASHSGSDGGSHSDSGGRHGGRKGKKRKTTTPVDGGTMDHQIFGTGTNMRLDGPMSFIAGEAGAEHLVVMRNPKYGIGNATPFGDHGSTYNININASVRSDGDVKAIAYEVERILNRKASVYGLRRM